MQCCLLTKYCSSRRAWPIAMEGDAYSTAASYIQTLGNQEWFLMCPSKFLWLRILSTKTTFQFRVLQEEDWARWISTGLLIFEKCYRELIEKSGARLLSDYELDGLYAEWRRALAGFDHSVQHEVQQELSGLYWLKLKAKFKGSSIGPFARRMKRKIDSIRHRGWQIKTGNRYLM